MNIKILMGILLTLSVIAYVIAILGNPFIFIIFFFIVFWTISIAVFLLFITNLILKLPSRRIRSYNETHKIRFKAVIFAYLIFFLFFGWVINHYLLPNIFHYVSILGNAGILFFMIFLGLGLMRFIKKKTLFIGIIIFSLFIFLLIRVDMQSYIYIGSSSVEKLESLPYLTWVSAEEDMQKSGVTEYNKKQSFNGINIYCPRNLPTAYLMDMSGKILHTWSAKINEGDSWQHIEMDRNGNLLCIVKDRMLIKLDWNSRIKWFKKMRFHHDIAIDKNEDIYVLSSEDEVIFSRGLPVPIINDYITVLSNDGKFKKKISLFKALNRQISLSEIIKVYFSIINFREIIGMVDLKIREGVLFSVLTPFDIFHTNTLEIIDRDFYGLCNKGDILLSFCTLDLVGILDTKTEKVIWSWGSGYLSRQHHPTFLENGNILIFDNGTIREYSRIIELDPFVQKIVWEYKTKPPKNFYSISRGASQRLPNGNTLITNSDSGHVFEVDKDKQIVWEFYNPEQDHHEKKRAAIYRMMRITDPENYVRLRGLK